MPLLHYYSNTEGSKGTASHFAIASCSRHWFLIMPHNDEMPVSAYVVTCKDIHEDDIGKMMLEKHDGAAEAVHASKSHDIAL